MTGNSNARCLMAIEIENEVSRKHLVGSLINAADLGRIGIIVARTPEKLRAFFNLSKYLLFLRSAEKPTFDTNNFLILNKEQFQTCLIS